MDSIYVQGGVCLRGKVKIQGSKNAALPIMAAALLIGERVILQNCPRISDVYDMIRILRSFGCLVKWERDGLSIEAGAVSGESMTQEAAGSMRSSVFVLGPLLGRMGRAEIFAPGGCVIGKRPIDLHLKALGKLGVIFEKEGEKLIASAPEGLWGNEVELEFPSVGATENIVMAAVCASGITTVRGAAREPEVQALCDFLNGCGASIQGVGETVLRIEGRESLHGSTFRIPEDRIVAGTYLLSGFSCGGEIFLENAPGEQMGVVLDIAEDMGATITATGNGIYAQYPERPRELSFAETGVYPGFPTDLQSVLLAVRCIGRGETVLKENIFENRFRVADGLKAMGAKIDRIDEKSVLVTGVEGLHGARVEACELRGGAALVAAALGASGETLIRGRRFIERGYENIGRDYRELGARIVSD